MLSAKSYKSSNRTTDDCGDHFYESRVMWNLKWWFKKVPSHFVSKFSPLARLWRKQTLSLCISFGLGVSRRIFPLPLLSLSPLPLSPLSHLLTSLNFPPQALLGKDAQRYCSIVFSLISEIFCNPSFLNHDPLPRWPENAIHRYSSFLIVVSIQFLDSFGPLHFEWCHHKFFMTDPSLVIVIYSWMGTTHAFCQKLQKY